MATLKRNSRASIRKQMSQKVQAVLKLKVELFTEIAAQEEAIDSATVESAQAIRKLQDNGVTLEEVADSTGISASRLRAIVKKSEELERLVRTFALPAIRARSMLRLLKLSGKRLTIPKYDVYRHSTFRA